MKVLFIHRCWQWTTLIERTFHLDNHAERYAVHSSDRLWWHFFKLFFQFSPCLFPLECLAWRLRKEANWGVVMYVPWLIFKTGCFAFWEEVAMFLSVFYYCVWNSSFNTIFMSFVAILSVLCHCSKAWVACWNITLRASGKTCLSHRFALYFKSYFYSKPLKLCRFICTVTFVVKFCREEWVTSIQEVADKLHESAKYEKEDSVTDEITLRSQKMVCYLTFCFRRKLTNCLCMLCFTACVSWF